MWHCSIRNKWALPPQKPKKSYLQEKWHKVGCLRQLLNIHGCSSEIQIYVFVYLQKSNSTIIQHQIWNSITIQYSADGTKIWICMTLREGSVFIRYGVEHLANDYILYVSLYFPKGLKKSKDKILRSPLATRPKLFASLVFEAKNPSPICDTFKHTKF